MQMRTLGTDLNVSAVGLGCMGFSHAYGAPTEEAETVRLIRRAFDLGYTFFDTAEVYGTADDPHVNETLVGKALADVKNHTVIATKLACGLTRRAERFHCLWWRIPARRPSANLWKDL